MSWRASVSRSNPLGGGAGESEGRELVVGELVWLSSRGCWEEWWVMFCGSGGGRGWW